MNDSARSALRRLIAEFDAGLRRDPQRLGGLLRDECGEAKQEINLLIDAMHEQVVDELAGATEPLQVVLPRLAQRMTMHRGTDPAYARWAVESWALALGMDVAASTPAPAPGPMRPPAPAPGPHGVPPPAPTRSLFERLGSWFIAANGRPRWKVVLPIALLILAPFLTKTAPARAPYIVKIDFGGRSFTGNDSSVEPVTSLVGDGQRYPAEIYFEDPQADIEQLRVRMLVGEFAGGKTENVYKVELRGRSSGKFIHTFSGSAATAVLTAELTLIDLEGNVSKPVLLRYAFQAPPQRGGNRAPAATSDPRQLLPQGLRWPSSGGSKR
ncbi:hypothetical protein [Methylibium sp.]|uniref:hypothetical protein n=1 Tax=Methylibium sp. TaxID=2067992 RepID=UPI003D11EBC9